MITYNININHRLASVDMYECVLQAAGCALYPTDELSPAVRDLFRRGWWDPLKKHHRADPPEFNDGSEAITSWFEWIDTIGADSPMFAYSLLREKEDLCSNL